MKEDIDSLSEQAREWIFILGDELKKESLSGHRIPITTLAFAILIEFYDQAEQNRKQVLSSSIRRCLKECAIYTLKADNEFAVREVLKRADKAVNGKRSVTRSQRKTQ